MIRLIPMTAADFQAYLAETIPEYAAEKVQAGNWSASEALERSRLEYEHYLPQGIHTPNHFLYNLINADGENVGLLWYGFLGEKTGNAFILDFKIRAPYRRRGYASQSIAALETQAKTQGIHRLDLHVFAHNTAARELYKKAGFIETNVNMSKKI